MANANVRGLIEAATKGARNLQTLAVYHLVSSDEVKKITKKELLESLFDKEELAYLERATELVRDDQSYFQDLRFVIGGEYIMNITRLRQFIPGRREFAGETIAVLDTIRAYCDACSATLEKWKQVNELLNAFALNFPEASIPVRFPAVMALAKASGDAKVRKLKGAKSASIKGELLPKLRDATETVMGAVFLPPTDFALPLETCTISLYVRGTQILYPTPLL